ncbi:DUF1294 domain-containing protein [Ferrimonas sediminicola]|uniref:DUF1294 domain-containing protein n=1 Tax=Ferrimonas sediminicola TaxID=2569538 RepID=A0A4U1B8G3_9GAMM|nr:DUF1294 domain-containing protein [Ferrimonas sediminicola]TKB46801.1 DUF1294 domain-containing protein [Ferrimonas sediminicola]
MPLGLTLTLATLPLLLLWPLLRHGGWPALWWAAASLVAFALYGIDKGRARRGAWRIPEMVLHLASLAGGWSGALLGQQLWRHKTRKWRFQVVFWGIGLVQGVLLVELLWLWGQHLAPLPQGLMPR